MPYESLFQYNGNSTSVPPIVVFDYKVYARDIEQRVKQIEKNLRPFPNKQSMKNFIKANWAYSLNRGCDALNLHKNKVGFTGIVVDDVKGKVELSSTDHPEGLGYWRNTVGYAQGLPPYKGGRKPKDEICMLAIETGYEYIREHGDLPLISQELFEADDLAGQLARYKRQGIANNRMMYLSTLDGDWSVLVDAEPSERGFNADSPNIVWVNTRVWNDRIRGNPEVIDYFQRKENVTLDHPSQVSKLKNIRGDAGDNLFKGAGLRLFDLLDEDSEYQLSDLTKARLRVAMQDNTNTCKVDHLEKAMDFLIAHGFTTPDVPNPTEPQYQKWRENVKLKKSGFISFSELYDDNKLLFEYGT